ncbi:MAG: DUF434 domain-containing protein [Planctomycetota bacterium]|jgi:hypothetical protein
MPDLRKHRGPHPEDASLFAPDALLELAAATAELSWLLSRGYADKATLKLVGDRHGLNKRQRVAAWRCACSDQQLADRAGRRLAPAALGGQTVHIDGFNVITTIEAALSGGVILKARDGCFRDMASMHGTYRKVAETVPAIQLVGSFLAELDLGPITWLLDRPVANSGKLRQMMLATADTEGWSWQVELVANPDRLLIDSDAVVASADSAVLDWARSWTNLARHVVEATVDKPWVVDLG